jgi:hypothetical protein
MNFLTMIVTNMPILGVQEVMLQPNPSTCSSFDSSLRNKVNKQPSKKEQVKHCTMTYSKLMLLRHPPLVTADTKWWLNNLNKILAKILGILLFDFT